MKTYFVQWSIDIEAESPREAAEKAREIQLDPESIATWFRVKKYDNSAVLVLDEMIYTDKGNNK